MNTKVLDSGDVMSMRGNVETVQHTLDLYLETFGAIGTDKLVSDIDRHFRERGCDAYLTEKNLQSAMKFFEK